MRAILAFLLVFNVYSLCAQEKCKFTSVQDSLTKLTEQDLYYLSKVPALDVNKMLLKDLLPQTVDNSTLQFFRPIWAQSDYCCGQAASILYMFTYEMNRLRNLPSNVTSNQYPTHFAWNWMNGPDNNRGVSYMNSLELLKFTGTPTVADWGGTPDFGGGSRWMTGYPKYYNGMHNKVDEYYSINVGTEEGLNVLRNWLHNHNENSTVGGIACIYIQFTSPSETLAPGTPEAGKYIIPAWGAYANHGMVILGYNDSIRWDYNGDGLYTIDIDINNDGVVDLKDREIGAVKVVNDFGTGWANGGYCYAMYKSLADKFGNGGIWNNAVHVVKPKQTYAPLVTYKVSLKHSSRREISVEAGISSNLSDTVPQHIIENTIVNFQGGNQYMQGGTTVTANMTMEFGMDVTPLLNYVQSGQPARFFFRVREFDRDSPSDGIINSFSVFDYSSGTVETACTSTLVPIANNAITTLWVNHTPVFDRPAIVEDTLDDIVLYENFTQQLTATGGEPPYKFKLRMNYTEQTTQEAFPNTTAQGLNLGDWTHGKAEVPLNFNFNFYNKTYNRMYVHTDGFITFESEDLPWVYYYDEDKTTLLKYFKGISVFTTDIEMVNPNNGVWMEQFSDSIIIRWCGTVPDYVSNNYEVNFAVKLRSDGSISYYYNNSETYGFQWVAGVSNGDYCNWQPLRFSNSTFNIIGEKSFKIMPGNVNFLNDIALSESGLMSGIVTEAYDNYPVVVEVTDNQGIKNTKDIRLTSQGLQFDYTVLSGDDSIPEYGESAEMAFVVRNIGSITLDNIQFTLSSSSPYIDWTDSLFSIASLSANQEVVIPTGVTFNISNQLPNATVLPILFDIECNQLQQSRTADLIGRRPDISVVSSFVTDIATPLMFSGDTALLHVVIRNNSLAQTLDGVYALENISPYVSLLTGSLSIDTLDYLEVDTLTYQVVASTTAPWETVVSAAIGVSARYTFSQSLPLEILINFNTEVFESGDLLTFDWTSSGSADWFAVQPGYAGQYAARSGVIAHDQSSILELTMETTADGDLQFYRKVSSELNYDYLKFYVDNVLRGSWSGTVNWERMTYSVPMGVHTFKWEYSKDVSVASGSDCAWIDNVVFPPLDESNLPFMTVSPASFSHSLPPDSIMTDTLRLSNIGGGKLVYSLRTVNGQPWVNKSITGSYIASSLLSFFAGDTVTVPLTVHNGSNDSEWLRDIGIVVPQGITFISAQPFIGGSGGAMNYTGMSVTGDTLKWHGQDGSGWGVVQGGQDAQSSITLFVPHTYSGDLVLDYKIVGDIYGALPHELEDNITISNGGQELSWLSYTPVTDTIFASDQMDVILTFNSTGLAQGVYTCELEVQSGSSQLFIVPVELTVSYLQYNPLSVYVELYPDSMHTENILATSFYHLPFFVNAEIDYSDAIADSSWLEVAPSAVMIPASGIHAFELNFDATGLNYGDYEAVIRLMDQQYYVTELPILMHVFPNVQYSLQSSGQGMILYPNPASDVLWINLSSETSSAQVTICNATGQLVRVSETVTYPYHVDLKGLVPGIYAVKFICNEKNYTGRFVKK